MKLVKKLSKTEQKTLEDMRENHKRKITRKRAHSILLNQEGYYFKKIGHMLGVCRQSVSNWLKAWETDGIAGLIEKKRTGRPKKLNGGKRSHKVSERTSKKPKNSTCGNHGKNGRKN